MVRSIIGGALVQAVGLAATLGIAGTSASASTRVVIGVGVGSGFCGPRYCAPVYARPCFPAPYAPICAPVCRPAPLYCATPCGSWSGFGYRYGGGYGYGYGGGTTIISSTVYSAAPAPVYVDPAPVTVLPARYDGVRPSVYEREDMERWTARGPARETYEREVIETRTPRVETVRGPRPEPCPVVREECGESYTRLIERGWDAVVDEYTFGAMDRFARAYRLRPCDAEPRIGYAVAAALRCEDRAAVWSMRRAFEVDARDAVLPSNGLIERRVERAGQRYEDLIDRRERRGRRPEVDDLFMAAATRYLVGDAAQARRYIERAVDLCDRSESTRRLRDLICAGPGASGDRERDEPRHD